MGRMPLPSIDRWEDVLEIVTNQDKYVKYMIEFQQAHDAAVASLGNLNVKELADAYLVSADEKLMDANKKIRESEIEASRHIDQAVELSTRAADDIATRYAALKDAEAEIAESKSAHDAEKADFFSFVEKKHADLDVIKAEIHGEQDRLAADVAEFQAKKDKAEAVFKAFQ